MKNLIFNILYYIFHYNYLLGAVYKFFSTKFFYKNLKIDTKIKSFPTPLYSSFIFNTYEVNDRIVIEKYLSKKNKCIIFGGGLGFIPCLVSKISKKKILVFEINKEIISNLKKNLILNKSKFKLINKNLVFNKKDKFVFNSNSRNFLTSALKKKSSKNYFKKNIYYKNISLKYYNTLIIDAEGYEYEIIKNISKLKNIKYIFFELHTNILGDFKTKVLFKILRKNGFKKKFDFLGSYFYSS